MQSVHTIHCFVCKATPIFSTLYVYAKLPYYALLHMQSVHVIRALYAKRTRYSVLYMQSLEPRARTRARHGYGADQYE